jgi:hypothetical protein
MSVNRMVTTSASPIASFETAQVRALVQSIVTNGSSPTTHASWPDGIS